MPLYKRTPSGPWWVRIGSKTRQTTGTKDREKAQEFERILTERLWRLERLGDRGAVSWAEASQRWLSDSTRPRKRDAELLTWLSPHIGEHSVAEIAHPDVLENLRKHGLTDGWSHSTVDRMMGTVSAVLHACVGWQYLTHAPTVPLYRPPRDEPRWLTVVEFEALKAELPYHLQLAARFAVYSLLRMRAMLKLTWDRVSLDERRIWIPRSHQKASRTFGLSISADAVAVLRELKTLSPEGAWVFQWKGKPIDDCNTLAFQKALQRARITRANWHTLRHTGASWAVQSGVPLQEVMLLGDWKDYRSVLRYAHLAPSQTASAAERIAQWAHNQTEAIRRDSGRITNDSKRLDGGAEGDRTLDLRIANAGHLKRIKRL